MKQSDHSSYNNSLFGLCNQRNQRKTQFETTLRLFQVRQMFTSSKAPFTWRKVKGLPSYPNYPERANFSYISLQNLTNCLREKQKDGWVRRVTCLAGSPPFDGSVSLLAKPTLLMISTLWLTQPGQLGEGDTIRTYAASS